MALVGPAVGPLVHSGARLSSRIFLTSLREFCLAVGLLPDTTSEVTIDFSSTSRAYRVGITWL